MKTKAILILAAFLLVGSSSLYAKSALFVWITDMYNQKSVKPQEQGSMLAFPEGVVSVDGRVYDNLADDAYRMAWIGREMNPETATKNPFAATPESLANGKLKYNTYCKACHGVGNKMNPQGMADSKVNGKGMVAPMISVMTPAFSDGYIYYKAKLGGGIMPPLGYATTDKDRWDIVNYIRNSVEK